MTPGPWLLQLTCDIAPVLSGLLYKAATSPVDGVGVKTRLGGVGWDQTLPEASHYANPGANI